MFDISLSTFITTSKIHYYYRPLPGISLFESEPIHRFSDHVVLYILFPSPIGDFFIWIKQDYDIINIQFNNFRPLSGISLFEYKGVYISGSKESFRPLSGISLFEYDDSYSKNNHGQRGSFRPLSGISLFE